MDRREFTKTCLMCVTGSLVTPLIVSCQTTHYISGNLGTNGLTLPRSEFNYTTKGQSMQRAYIIVRNEALEFPIYVFRFSDTEYSALWMRCTHQGNELQASGDHLTCPAHGSEFNNRGLVAEGPAMESLRQFKVTPDGENIFIDLHA